MGFVIFCGSYGHGNLPYFGIHTNWLETEHFKMTFKYSKIQYKINLSIRRERVIRVHVFLKNNWSI